ENDCLVETSPEGFALSNIAGTQLAQGTTNANGIIRFTGLTNGTYKLDETTGDWCHAEADYVDAAGNLLVKNSGNTDVFIYNCGARQVGTLPVTGSGDTAVGANTASLFMPAAGAMATLIVLAALTVLRRRPTGHAA
ncbi:MAG: prealbumin-like fold domain-containing protein, partial [Thermomicrobiales bacterium]